MRLPQPTYSEAVETYSRPHLIAVSLSGSAMFRCYFGGTVGFEPTSGSSPKHAFQACDLNRSSTSPRYAIYRTPSLKVTS